jgi:2-polyprenyl-6-hydroxyphenyl methylase/3-demethylubiquinone-9 3-methyltransferase
MTQAAAEQISLEQAMNRLPTSRAWTRAILQRIRGIIRVEHGMRVLDIGAAQGRGLVELVEQGFEAYGVEPWEPAREVANQLAEHMDLSFDIRAGHAEDIPFSDGYFDIIIAMGVMEHVTDLNKSLEEIHRVLKPGGVFWFNSASAMCPKQDEIRGFPFFGWYPDRLKKVIMHWAIDNRPHLIGHTKMPAIHWWTNRVAERRLREAGFGRVWTRWELRQENEGSKGKQLVVKNVKRSRTLQRLFDTVVMGCSYAASKEK